MPEERAGAGRRRYGNIPRMTVRSNAVSNAFPWGSDDVERRYRGYLPHLEGPNRVYFVTFRLADSLPEEVRAKLKARKANIRRRQAANEAAIPKVSRGPARDAGVTAREIEDTLDRGTGACHLRRADVAEIVASAIRHFDGQRYRLYAWCVMPNHVHAVVHPLPGWKLAQILHSWKCYTAHKANGVLRRSGEFWQREYYDRMLRDGGEFLRAVEYVANNPAKAGMNNWPWMWTFLQERRPASTKT